MKAKISAASAGANVLVAAVAGKIVRVTGLVLTSAGAAVSCYFCSAATPIAWDSNAPLFLDKTGVGGPPGFVLGTAGVFIPLHGDVSGSGYFETEVGEALNLVLSGAYAVGGFLVYDLM